MKHERLPLLLLVILLALLVALPVIADGTTSTASTTPVAASDPSLTIGPAVGVFVRHGVVSAAVNASYPLTQGKWIVNGTLMATSDGYTGAGLDLNLQAPVDWVMKCLGIKLASWIDVGLGHTAGGVAVLSKKTFDWHDADTGLYARAELAHWSF